MLLATMVGIGFVTRAALTPPVPGLALSAEPSSPPVGLAGVLGPQATLAGFARATEPRAFRFPEDHGAHPDYRAEWWYFTGNLTAQGGRHFGYQFTLFRFGLPRQTTSPGPVGRWRDGNLYMAHLAVTDTAAGRFHAFERFGRPPAAGALTREDVRRAAQDGTPFHAWLDDWRVALIDGVWQIHAEVDGVGVSLNARPTRPRVLQGDSGLSVKGASPGNASYYYSETRLQTHGQVRTEQGAFTVSGSSWLDREWSTSALEAGQQGWDWFALQLDDGRDLMFYRLRRAAGGVDPHSAGVLVGHDGTVQRLSVHDVRAVPTAFWTSSDGIRWPIAWTLEVPQAALSLRLRARVESQRHAGVFPYWEGAVSVRGRGARAPVRGQGYVELTGYGPVAQNGIR